MDINIEVGDGRYKYENEDGWLYFYDEDEDGNERRRRVAPYIPPQRLIVDGELEEDKDYNQRILENIQPVIDMIEESKEHIDAQARRHAIESTYELADTGLTFASAFEEAKAVFSDPSRTKAEFSIPNILWGGVKAGVDELTTDIVGDIEKGFDLSDFIAKYGPALNNAIWYFGRGYGQDGIDYRHLIYMIYLVKKHNILNAVGAEIMEKCMAKGIYVFKTGGIKRKLTEGLFWILAAGTIADYLLEKIDNVLFTRIDNRIKSFLKINPEDDNYIPAEKNTYTDNLGEMYDSMADDINNHISEGIIESEENIKEIEFSYEEFINGELNTIIELLVDRYSIIRKILGADKAYTVYKTMVNNQDIKLVKEENINGPGIEYGSKIVMGQGLVHAMNVEGFKHGDQHLSSLFGDNLNLVGNISKKGAQYLSLGIELKALRENIVFPEEKETDFQGFDRFHGKIDDLSKYINYLFDNEFKIEQIPNFVAYFDEESVQDIEDYIRELENNRSNKSSLNTPKRSKHAVIIYDGEYRGTIEDEEGQVEKRKIHIGYRYSSSKTKVDYVEDLLDNFAKVYEESDRIFLTNKNAILFAEARIGSVIDQDIFKVEKVSLEEIAKEKGLIDLEIKRRRLRNGQSYIDNVATVEEIISLNTSNRAYNLEVSPRGDYVVLYFASISSFSGVSPYLCGGVLGRLLIGSKSNSIMDVKFPYEEYKLNRDLMYGSSDSERRIPYRQEAYDLWIGLGSSYDYSNDGSECDTFVSDSRQRIYINGKLIGQSLKRVEDYENWWDQITGKQIYKEYIEDNEMTIEVKYTFDINGNILSNAYLVIEYKYKDSENGWNRLKINDFINSDYGIIIPDKMYILPGTNSNQRIG